MPSSLDPALGGPVEQVSDAVLATMIAQAEADFARNPRDSMTRMGLSILRELHAARAEIARLNDRWAEFRDAVLDTTNAFQSVARCLRELDLRELADAVQCASTSMYVSIQEPDGDAALSSQETPDNG